ncbi:MAG TPA: tetratricopeptide repeat protein [Vicinamibacterales bacterium]|nr:tetratricopeptide repeat protein [Vicinamibacterales bacterium]
MSPALILAGAIVLQAPAPAQAVDPAAEAYFLFLQSRRLESDGNVSEAIASLRRALTLLPKAAEIQAELAGVYAREGRAAEAVTAAEAALGIEPKNREAHRILGFVKAAVASDPGYASTAGMMNAEAIRHLEQVLADSFVDLSAELTLGRLYAKTGQHEKALATIKKFLSEQPGYPEALLLLAESAEQLGKWEDAAGAWSEVVEMGPRGRTYRGRQATALVKLGDQYFQLKKYKEAADAFDRALAGDRTVFDPAEVQRKRDRARELAGK